MDQPQVQVPGVDKPEANAEIAEINSLSLEVEMRGMQDAVTDTNSSPAPSEQGKPREDAVLPDAQTEIESPILAKKNAGFGFVGLLMSPIVEIVVGDTVLRAHQNLILESPFLEEFVKRFDESGPRRINLPDENVEALGCFLQFQYTRDYTVPQTGTSSEGTDASGQQLLQHARMYTLGEKLGLPALKSLAHTKIHRVNGTPSGELAYARYVYTHTPHNDTTIRRPIASFWASRSHVLRHEVEEEWKNLCFEVPEFAYDVLNMVLDRKEKEKTDQAEAESSGRGSARKRLRSGI